MYFLSNFAHSVLKVVECKFWEWLSPFIIFTYVGVREERRRRLTRVARAFVGLLEAVAKKAESQDKTKNNQYCH